MSEEKTKPPPRCKAILLCERVIRDAATGHRSLIEVFDRLVFPDFPVRAHRFKAYLQLVDGVGRYQVAVELQDLRNNVSLLRQTLGVIEFRHRLQKVHLVLSVPPLILTHPGSYDFIVFADEQEMDRQVFLATHGSHGHGQEETEG